MAKKPIFFDTVMNKIPLLMQSNIKLRKAGVLVGIPASETKRKDGKITNAEIGYLNEYGSPIQGIPARPFLVPAIEEGRKEIAAAMKPKDNLKPDTKELLNKAGLRAVSLVQMHITEQKGFKPLAPETIKARQRARRTTKAGTKALIDTGQLRASISYLVEDENG